MGKIEKILKKGPVEGQTTEVYPVTSTKAVYDENNKRLDNIITGLQESVYLNTPIPISTDNTLESKAQNVKNISDYIEKAKAAGIADVNGMGVTCLIDDYLSGVGYIYRGTNVIIHGIKTTDDLVDNRVFLIENGTYYESKIQSENSNELSTTSKKLVPAINEVNTLAKSKGNGTITEVRMNGVSKGTSGVVDLGTVLTEHQDISGKQDKTDNTLATTNKTVIGAINEINTKVGNLTGALTWKGKLDTLPAVTDYEAGNVVSVGNKEYVLTVIGSTKAWEELGDEGSYLLKSAAEETYAKKTDIPTIPAIPTVNNPKVSIKMNGTEKGSFTLNQASAGEVDLGTVITAHQDISGKQDVISDLATIRSGAGKGATAVQPGDLAKIATSGSYTDLTNKPTIPTVTDTYSATSSNAMSGKAVASAISNKMDKVTLAKVATSGSYNDLTNKPTIPSAVTETTVSGWGFTKNAGTITGIKMNGASKGTSGVVDLGTVITAHQDISGKVDKTLNAKAFEGITIQTSNTTEARNANNAALKAYVDNLKSLGIVTTKGFNVPVRTDNNFCGYMTSVYAMGGYFLSGTIFKTWAGEYYIKDIVINPSGEYVELVNIKNDNDLNTTSKDLIGAINEVNILANNKQDTLTSGTNIKTINNQSLLGSGNIEISAPSITVDTSMSDTSMNPVQNKVIKAYIDGLVGNVTAQLAQI